MALTFGATTGDRVNCGSAASLDDPTSFSVLVYCFPTTLTNSRVLVSKYRGATQEGWVLELNGTGGNIDIVWERATQDMIYISNSAPLATGAWYLVAATADSTGNVGHLYVGTPTAAMAEVTYSTSQGGSGAPVSDAPRSFFIANRDIATPASSFQGRIGHVSFYKNRVMTLAEIEAQRLRQFAGTSCSLFMQLGFDGTGTQLDLSGNANNGTIAGTVTTSAHHPYIIPAASIISGHRGIIRTGSSIGRVV